MFTGSIAGVMLTDFWLLRRAVLDVPALYVRPARGCCACDSATAEGKGAPGANWCAFVAVGVAVAVCMPGFVTTLLPPAPGGTPAIGVFLTGVYRLSWFWAVGVSAIIYYVLERCFKTRAGATLDSTVSDSVEVDTATICEI